MPVKFGGGGATLVDKVEQCKGIYGEIFTEHSGVRKRPKKRTSMGHSNRSRPKNKHKRRTWKKYVGQGK